MPACRAAIVAASSSAVLDHRRNAVGGLGQQLRLGVDDSGRSASGYFGQRLREFRLGGLRREGIITTPAGSGGRPAVVQSSSAQAARWAAQPDPRCSSGVQEARTSTSARGASSAIPPNDSLDTEVTVPLGATYSAPWLARASISQDQPTWPAAGR